MLRTIKAIPEINALFRDGQRVITPCAVVIVAPTPKEHSRQGRVLCVAGKKLGGSVMRNKNRRVLKEAVRQAGGPWPGLDVAIIARTTTARFKPQEIGNTLRKALESLNALDNRGSISDGC